MGDLCKQVPTELGPEVTKKLGGPAKAAEVSPLLSLELPCLSG